MCRRDACFACIACLRHHGRGACYLRRKLTLVTDRLRLQGLSHYLEHMLFMGRFVLTCISSSVPPCAYLQTCLIFRCSRNQYSEPQVQLHLAFMELAVDDQL